MAYNKGDVVWVDLGDVPKASKPDKNKLLGSEQAKRRPCVILTDLAGIDCVIILPCTSQDKSTSPTCVQYPNLKSKLNGGGYIIVHQIRIISNKRIDSEIVGKMPIAVMDKVDVVLSDLFDL